MVRPEGAGIHPEGSGSRQPVVGCAVVAPTATAKGRYRLNAPAGLRSAAKRCAMNHPIATLSSHMQGFYI